MGRYRVSFVGDVRTAEFSVLAAGGPGDGWIYVFEGTGPQLTLGGPVELVPCRTPHVFEGDAFDSAMRVLKGLGTVERIVSLDDDKGVAERPKKKAAGGGR